MQRVRIGLTGLAFVFLLVMFATAFFGLVSRDSGAGDRGSQGGNAAQEQPAEPLAELGVTPGANPDKSTPANTASAVEPAPAAR